MFSQRWVNLAILLFLLGLALDVRPLSALAGFMLTFIAVGWAWNRASLYRLVYRRRFQHTRAFPQEAIAVSVTVENNKLVPVGWLRVEDTWPRAVGPVDEDALAPSHIETEGYLTNVYSLKWFERQRRNYQLACRQRGVYPIGPARLQSGDLFGLYESERGLDDRAFLVVYPRLESLEELGLPTADPFGDLRAKRRIFEDPARTMGVRDYRPEDGFRRVHWPATARTGRLQVKVFEPTTSRALVVCLNVATFEKHWQGMQVELLERLISVAGSLCAYAYDEGYSVGLIANGCLAHADQPFHLSPSRAPDQPARLLEALAGVSTFVTAGFPRFLLAQSPRLPWGATLVLVTAIMNGEASIEDSGRDDS